MKKLLTLFAIFYTFIANGQQFPFDGPWFDGKTKEELKQLSFQDELRLINDYWNNNKDKDKKGSGYKVFKRWEEIKLRGINDDGTPFSQKEILEEWDYKKSFRETAANRSNTNSPNNLNNNNAPISNWMPYGPFTHTNTGSWSSGQGRINKVVVDPTNPNVIYIGAPAGGLWKSSNHGQSWTNLTDKLPSIGVSGIAIDHTNSNIIYISTGDVNAGNTPSVGVYKSIDGGLTWDNIGMNSIDKLGEIVMHPTNNQILFVITNGGIFRSVNAGATWTLQSDNVNCSQGSIRFKPNDPNVIYASASTGFLKSTNGGNTFIEVGVESFGINGRIIIDVTPANPNYVYALLTSNNYFIGIYKSVDSGNTFTSTNTAADILESNQAWYDLALAVSDTNPEEIYTGCLNIWKSTNGGTTFTKLNSWSQPSSLNYTHADIHHLKFYNGKLYCGSDGGIYVSSDSGTTFTDYTKNGLQISQFYRIANSKASAFKLMGGLQDNGGYGYSNNVWKNYYGADGMDTAVHPSNGNIYYGFLQNGLSLNISTTAGSNSSQQIGAPRNEQGNWITPLVINNQGELFSGFKKLYKLVGNSWVSVSNDIFAPIPINILTIDPSNDNIMYAVKLNRIYKSTNKGVSFSPLFTASSDLNDLKVHSTNSSILYFTTVNGKIFKSVDGGIAFSEFGTSFSGAKNCIAHQANNINNPVFVGTNLGVYYIDDTMTSWVPYDTGLPNVPVRDLEINLIDKKIIAATYGRGVWMSDLLIITPEAPQNNPGKSLLVNNTTSSGNHAEISNLTYISKNAFTISCWIKPTGNQVNNSVVFASTDSAPIGLNFLNGNNTIGIVPGNISTNMIAPANEWTYLAISSDGLKINVYVNGNLFSTNLSSPLTTAITEIILAKNGNLYSNIEYDELTIWRRALTIDEIRQYRHLIKFSSTDLINKDMVRYYQMNDSYTFGNANNIVGGDSDIVSFIGTGCSKITSNAPVFVGKAEKLKITSLGLKSFPLTKFSIRFKSGTLNPNGDFWVSKSEINPDVQPDTNTSLGVYFVLNNYGTNQNVNLEYLRFYDIPSINSTSIPANKYKLYVRNSNAFGSTWGSSIASGRTIALQGNIVNLYFLNNGFSLTNMGQLVLTREP